MLRVALTGGIGTGKSYVLTQFASLGVPVIDADVLAREAVGPGSVGLDAIAARFGRDVLAPDGTLDRKTLAAVVFGDPAARRDLEAIVHPEVRAAMRAWTARFQALPPDRRPAYIVADIPLLFETGRAREFDAVIVTMCEPDEQVRRVRVRDSATEAEARMRLAAQLPTAEKARQADYVIRTGGAFAETDSQVRAVHRELIARAAARAQ